MAIIWLINEKMNSLMNTSNIPGFSIFKLNKLLIFLPIPDNERYEKEPSINDIKGIKVSSAFYICKPIHLKELEYLI